MSMDENLRSERLRRTGCHFKENLDGRKGMPRLQGSRQVFVTIGTLIEGCRCEDPPPTPQLTVPVAVVECIFIKVKYRKATG